MLQGLRCLQQRGGGNRVWWHDIQNQTFVVKDQRVIEKQHRKARGLHAPSPCLVVSNAGERKQTSLERAAREKEKYQI